MSEAPGGAKSPAIGIVVTGDNHLSPALPRLSPQRRGERRAWLRRGFAAAVDYALDHGAALFISLGDLFDTPAPSNQDRAFVAEQLRRLRRAGITCVAIGGNHDMPRMRTEHGGEAPQGVYAALGELVYFADTDCVRPRLFKLRGVRVAVAGLSNNPVAPPGSDPLANAAHDDPEGALDQADVALLAVHAAIEGLSRPNEGERAILRRSLDALPPAYRLVVAGHIHRFARQRMGEREIVVVGATERMEFGEGEGSPGFVWLEVGRGGARNVTHVPTKAQPRVEVTVHTSQLWSHGEPAGPDDTQPGDIIRAALDPACQPDTLALLRLTGALTREQHHQISLRDLIVYGQQRAFALDIDTSGLSLGEPLFALPTVEGRPEPLTPARMITLIAEETLRLSVEGAAGAPSPDDLVAARDLALARLRVGGEEDA